MNSEPKGIDMYIITTNTDTSRHRIVSGMRTLFSSIGTRARLALPVSVAAVFASSQYFCAMNRNTVSDRSTSAMAAAPLVS